ncbi:MAG TPA: hypothetical protein VK731_05110 [Candidatus Cybelea sp.]|nr:hypothetical protein [Candidatus Cybelea sp.]
MSAAAVASPLLPPPDKVRVINRSVRCFIFGLIGAVPCFGLGMVWLAFKLYRDIAAETGERVKLFPLYLTSAAGVWVAAACSVNNMPGGVLADAIVLFVLQFLFIRQQYLRNAPAEWNPARHLMYWGLGLANLGSILSAVTVLLVIYLVNHS